MSFDVIEYISRYIPREIRYRGSVYVFQLFINHAHYDIRICYGTYDHDKWMLLYENIANERDLLDALKLMRKELLKKRLLPKMYQGSGYTKKDYKNWLRSFDKK